MEYQESYQGWQLIVTTQQGTTGAWISKADVLDAGQQRVVLVSGSDDAYPSEEEARRAALSAAAAAIDRTRASRGKP